VDRLKFSILTSCVFKRGLIIEILLYRIYRKGETGNKKGSGSIAAAHIFLFAFPIILTFFLLLWMCATKDMPAARPAAQKIPKS
jgi:hypothetical protein